MGNIIWNKEPQSGPFSCVGAGLQFTTTDSTPAVFLLFMFYAGVNASRTVSPTCRNKTGTDQTSKTRQRQTSASVQGECWYHCSIDVLAASTRTCAHTHTHTLPSYPAEPAYRSKLNAHRAFCSEALMCMHNVGCANSFSKKMTSALRSSIDHDRTPSIGLRYMLAGRGHTGLTC